MKWIEILRKHTTALLQSESDTQYVIAYGYQPEEPEDQQWAFGRYFMYHDADTKAKALTKALELFRYKTETDFIVRDRLIELATLFKDCTNGDEEMEYVIEEMEDYEREFFDVKNVNVYEEDDE